MKRVHLVIAAALFAAGCGSDDDAPSGADNNKQLNEADAGTPEDRLNRTVTEPASPLGTVSGQVLDTNLAPLGGAVVELMVGSQTEARSATVDDKGFFRFGEVAAGAQVLLAFSKAGYATLRASSTVPSSAGNVPINNGNASFGPILLAKLDGKLRFQVATPDGRPAAGASASLRTTPAGSVILSNNDSTTSIVSGVTVESVADAQGILEFAGIPSPASLSRYTNGQYQLWISALDRDNDGIAEAGGYQETISGAAAMSLGNMRLVTLPYPVPSAGVLNVDNSNVGSLAGATNTNPVRNIVRPSEPIHVFFNQPVQAGSLLARLTDEYAGSELPLNVEIGQGGYRATLTPGAGVLVEGREYNVDVRAVSAQNGTIFTRTGFFFAGDPLVPKAVSMARLSYQENTTSGPASSQLNAGERVYVHFSAPISQTYASGFGHVYTFFNADIGGPTPGVIGDAPGEVGYPVGFELVNDEPSRPVATRIPAETPTFGILSSGYSTRWSFTYSGNALQNLNNLSVRVQFSQLPSRGINGTYESFWGEPITHDLTGTDLVKQPAPVAQP